MKPQPAWLVKRLFEGTLFRGVMFWGCLLGLGGVSSRLEAQEGPQFSYVADAGQVLLGSASDWNAGASAQWLLDLNGRLSFSQGSAAFILDGSAYLPLGNSLQTGQALLDVAEAYVRLTPLTGLDLTFGKKRLNLGVGQTFTVGDSINPAINFFDQKSGFRGFTWAWSPNAWLGWTGGVSLERELGNSPSASAGALPTFQANNLAGATQFTLQKDRFQGTASLCFSPGQTFNPALGLSYDFSGVILTAEGALEFLPQGLVPSTGPLSTWTAPTAWTQPAPSGSVGARYTWSLGDIDLTLQGEGLYWGQGWTTEQTADFNAQALPASTAASVRPALRDRLNTIFHLDVNSSDTFDLAGFGMLDLQDASMLYQASLTLYPWDGLDLVGVFQAATGSATNGWNSVPLPPPSTQSARYVLTFQTRYHF